MGLSSILTRFISTLYESSSQQLNSTTKQVSHNETDKQLLAISVSILKHLFINQGPILDVLFSSGVFNSVLQLLDSNNMSYFQFFLIDRRYVDIGTSCLLHLINNFSTLSTAVVLDIFFSSGIIKFLFSGLLFCHSEASAEVPFPLPFLFSPSTRLPSYLIFSFFILNKRMRSISVRLFATMD